MFDRAIAARDDRAARCLRRPLKNCLEFAVGRPAVGVSRGGTTSQCRDDLHTIVAGQVRLIFRWPRANLAKQIVFIRPWPAKFEPLFGGRAHALM